MERLWTAYHNIPKLERQPILKLFIVHGETSADFNKALKNLYTDDIAAKLHKSYRKALHVNLCFSVTQLVEVHYIISNSSQADIRVYIQLLYVFLSTKVVQFTSTSSSS